MEEPRELYIKTIIQRLMNFLQKTVPFKICGRNLQNLLNEIFKVKILKIVNEVFDIIKCPYRLKNELRFKSQNIRTVKYDIETATFAGSRIWSYMPCGIKESTSLKEFRSKIKT